MKKVLYILMSVMMLLIACNKSETKETVSHTKVIASPADYSGTIGIAKIVSHNALDATEQGIIDELREQGYVNAKFDQQNANGEVSTASSIANKFKNENPDVVVGIATPMAVAIANQIKTTPVVFTATTDPIGANLRKTIDKEDTNITGVSDQTPIKEQLLFALKLKQIKKLGIIYNAGEPNSVTIAGRLQKVCDELGIELIVSTVTNTSEVKQAANVIAPKVDAIYVGTDNVVYAAMTSLVPTAAKYKVPVIASVPEDNAGAGITMAYGLDYYLLGRETGKVVARILQGEKPGDIPVKFLTEPNELKLYLNPTVAKELGLTVTDELLQRSK